MKHLTLTFLKIFFRNPRAIFFVIFLPAGIFAILGFLGLEEVIRFEAEVTYAEFLLPGIMAMALMQTGIYTVAYTLIDYRRTQVLKRLSFTPLSPVHFLWAQIISRFVIALLQAAALIVIGIAVFGTKLQGLWFLPILIFFGSALFLNFGFIITALAKDYEEAAPYTTIIGLPLVFLGDVFFSVDNLPKSLSSLADYLPLKPLSSLLRYDLLSLDSPLLGQDILVLILWLVILSLVASYVFAKKVYK